MPVIHPGLFLIMQRFPDHKDVLRQLHHQNEPFQTLCDDYKKCKSALDHWALSKHELAPDRYREYLELKKDLESEIQQRLSGLL
jgi:hypothetical protein